ncbi:hypothetical protein AB0K09_15230 [Streptomyces sp. NPDC049577]|uniref:hypothetical protein n=1 Tax=Streptomyces sp. NPDC049577 TaxID=3155153 RepID=UPI003434BE8E
MVNRPTVIIPEIARRHNRPERTVKHWRTDPSWPKEVNTRGHFKEYDEAEVEEWIRTNIYRDLPDLEPARLYTAQQLEDAGVGVKASTIRAYLSANRWPAPDSDEDGVSRWRGDTVLEELKRRRKYRRKTT